MREREENHLGLIGRNKRERGESAWVDCKKQERAKGTVLLSTREELKAALVGEEFILVKEWSNCERGGVGRNEEQAGAQAQGLFGLSKFERVDKD